MRRVFLLLGIFTFVLNNLPAQSAEIFNIAQGTNPRIAKDNAGFMYAVFEGFETDSDTRDIFCSKSSQSVLTWSAPVNISKTHGVSTTPAIAVETSGALDVVWRDTTSGELHADIYFTRSSDGGKTWSKAKDISHSTGVCSEPAITYGSDNLIHIVWVDTSSFNGRPDIFYSCSSDQGKTWSTYEDISPTPGISSVPTIIACADGIIHCAWLDTSSGEERPDIFYTRKIGKSWTTPINISNSPRLSSHPCLASGLKGRVFLCWADNSQKKNAADIWCALGKNGRFNKPINISDTPGVSSQPMIVADERGRVAITWSDTSLKLSKPDIYARISTDNGDDFSNVLYLTHTEGLSIRPTAILIGDKMVVAWEDVTGTISMIKSIILDFKGIGTGPIDQVNPTVHRVNSNSR